MANWNCKFCKKIIVKIENKNLHLLKIKININRKIKTSRQQRFAEIRVFGFRKVGFVLGKFYKFWMICVNFSRTSASHETLFASRNKNFPNWENMPKTNWLVSYWVRELCNIEKLLLLFLIFHFLKFNFDFVVLCCNFLSTFCPEWEMRIEN